MWCTRGKTWAMRINTKSFQMTGLLLCGGKSSRMGSDKGLLTTSGITWTETAFHKLSAVVSPIAISVNSEQFPLYTKYFTKNLLIIDNDQLKIGGPLCGLLSAHIQMPGEDILLLACDLLFMETAVFDALLLQQQKMPEKEAFVFTQEEEAEPLCGIYRASGLKRIFSAYQSGNLGKPSMKHILETLNTSLTALPEEWKLCFRNINTRHDLSS